MSLSQKKSNKKPMDPLLDSTKTEQLGPYDRYGSLVAKNMMQLQRRYRAELNPKQMPVARSMRVLLPPAKKLNGKSKKSSKL